MYVIHKIHLFLRKINSALLHIIYFLRSLKFYVIAFLTPSITIGRSCQFGKSVKLSATDGGEIFIGCGVCIGDHVQIIAGGGMVFISDKVFIGTGSIIVCQEKIFIGKNTLIAEYVVIRDQDHRTDKRPLSQSGFHTSPIHIGSDVWIGCKASILRGSHLGNRCVIGAHALVKSNIAEDMLAVGIPAKSRLIRHSNY